MKIVTHNGVFHSDEALACALLINSYECEIVRTRNEDIITSAACAVDVGGFYDQQNGQFDHHQIPKDDANYGVSSFGMVAKFLKLQGWEALVTETDKRDCFGADSSMQYHELFEAISASNHFNIGGVEQDARFIQVISLLAEMLKEEITVHETVEKLQEIAAKDVALKEQHQQFVDKHELKNHEWRISSTFMTRFSVPSYQGHAKSLKDGILVTWDDLQHCWTIQSNTEFYNIIEVEDSIFLHKGGFIAKTASSNFRVKLEDAMGKIHFVWVDTDDLKAEWYENTISAEMILEEIPEVDTISFEKSRDGQKLNSISFDSVTVATLITSNDEGSIS